MADDEPKPVFLDLVKLINNEVGEEIVKLLATTESPFHAIATLGAVIASVTTSIVNKEDKVIANINTIAEFSNQLAHEILERVKNDSDAEDVSIEDGAETLH